jgi:PAS domain S-box-containing protein
MRLGLNRGVLMALLAVLLLINVWITYHNTQQLYEDAHWVARTHEVMDLTTEVLLALVDAETGERGFVITGKDEFLQPYEDARGRLKERLAKLKTQAKDDQRQQNHIKKLETLAGLRMAQLGQVIELRRKNEKEAQNTIAHEKGKQQMDAIRDLIAAMQLEEHELLQQREGQSRHAYRVAVTTGLLTGFLGLVFVAALVWLLERNLRVRQKAAEAINAQREWLRVTLASIGDAVIATDIEGRVVLLNNVAQSLTGWSQAEAETQSLETVFRIVNQDSRQPAENPVRRALREGKVVGLANHTLLIARDGTEKPIDDSAAPIRNRDGKLIGVVLVFRDVTERRQADRALRESEEKYRNIVETANEGIWLLDANARITFANRRMAEILRCTVEEVLGHAKWDFILPEDQEKVRALYERRRAGISEQADIRFLRKDGTTIWTLMAARPLFDEQGTFQGALDLFTDVTERRRAEESLREADRRKDEFLAMLAHELRNPLAPIRNALQLLKLAGNDPGVSQRARELMERQVEYLVRLVDDLLDVSRIMRGKIELRSEPVELATVLARAVETTQPIIDEEGHELTVVLPSGPLWVHGDVVRLAQAVGNLLNNAAKYTEQGGKIRLSAGQEDHQAVIRVRDTGVGIAAEQVPHIFEMFVQGDRRTKNARGGLGIGLSLVRALVRMHGGSVAAHSAGVGKGSEFVVRLPLLERGQAEVRRNEQVEQMPAAGSTPRRVLVVDDSPDAADSLALLLQLEGHQVRVAYDGQSALEQAEADPPDIAFLDLGMPNMDGFELVQRFRKSPRLQRVVLVAVTGWGQEEDRRRTRAAGFDDHLVKPVQPEALHALLSAAN